MQWWANEPIIFVRAGDLESHRIRFMVAEKRAGCAVRVLQIDEAIPEYLLQLNPLSIYPFLVCRDLVCYGHALDELIHERYPAPQLLPTEPVKRAQVRVLCDEVAGWYRLSPSVQRAKLDELACTIDPLMPFFASNEITCLDVAIAPLLFASRAINYHFTPGALFSIYAKMMVARPAYDILPRPQLLYVEARPPPVRLDAA